MLVEDKLLDQNQRTSLCREHELSFASFLSFCSSVSPGGCWVHRSVSQRRYTKLRKLSILWGNHWQICLAFAPEDTLALISWIASRTLICPRGRCHSVSQAVCYINVFEKIVQNKSCSRTCRKRGIHEDLSLNNSYFFLHALDFCWIFPWVCYSVGHSY